MLFIPYALHDRDAYARTAREKFESLGKAGAPPGTRAGLGWAAAGRAARAAGSRRRLRTSAWKEMFLPEAILLQALLPTPGRKSLSLTIQWHLFILLNHMREHFFPSILNLCLTCATTGVK